MFLELKDLRVHYDKVEALKGISLEVEEGTIVTLIGANGAGKTTTLRTIMGVKSPTTGEIWHKGLRLDKLDTQMVFRLGIAMVPEGRKVFPYLSIMENLMTGAFLRGSREEINRTLEMVFQHFPILEERYRQQGGSLSGGEQQMVAIGRSLMSNPKLLLMDEPTMGLSPLMVREVADVVVNINRDGVSIILVEQNAKMALKIANKGYVLETGTIALRGDTKDLINNGHVKKAYLGG